MSRFLHIVPGTDNIANGMVVVAKLLAKEQRDSVVVDLNHGIHGIHGSDVEEVWIHGMWRQKEWFACWRAVRADKRLVRMTHGSLSPLYLKSQSPVRKWFVGPIERFFLRRCYRIVATCEEEKGWIEAYLGKKCPPVEIADIKRFFDLGRAERVETCRREDGSEDGELHLLYLGRRHPLKGVEYLEKAVAELNSNRVNPVNPVQKNHTRSICSTHNRRLSGVRDPSEPRRAQASAELKIELRIVSNAFGEELEKVWAWCDVLVLPTLSENFGLVVAEALERGKRVITTDGAPAWGDGNDYGGRLVYLKGYRDGTPEERVRLLKSAIVKLCRS